MKALDKKTSSIFLAGLFILIGGLLLSLFYGATTEWDDQVFWILRFPRTLTAIAVGGGLAVAGALIQASLGNPLADPYTTGIASAAALGAVIGAEFLHNSFIGSSAFAFVFALGGLFLLAVWLKRSFRNSTEVLLAGVVAGLFFTSLATLLRALSDPATWSANLVWMMGSLGHLSFAEALTALLILVFTSVLGWLHWKPLDLIAIDETTAEASGVDVAVFRKRVFIIASIITAVCVSTAGIVGFLGLIVPHSLRRIGLRTHFLSIPAAFLYGAAILLCSDVFARIVARPSELPVGVITAIVGAPIFLILVRKETVA